MITDIITAITQFSQVQTSAVHPFCYIDFAVENTMYGHQCRCPNDHSNTCMRKLYGFITALCTRATNLTFKFFHWHRRELAKSYTHQPLAYALFSICGCSTARDSCSSLNAPWQNTFPTLGWLRLKDSYWDLLPAKHPDMPSIALLPSLAFSSAPPVIVTAPFDHALVGGSALFDLAGIHGIPKDQEKE